MNIRLHYTGESLAPQEIKQHRISEAEKNVTTLKPEEKASVILWGQQSPRYFLALLNFKLTV